MSAEALIQPGLPVFALDVDEVLADTLTQCNAWHNATYGTNFTISDYKSYVFCETWQCTDAEAMNRFRVFTQSEYWDAIKPVEGAQQFVRDMAVYFRLAVVTSRQNYLKESTFKWLDKHFGLATFSFVKFGNQWLADKDAIKISKLEMCREIGAIALVDDLPKYILQVAPVVRKSILFNLRGEQNWSVIHPAYVASHPNICTCYSWPEVFEVALSLADSVNTVPAVKALLESTECVLEANEHEVPV